jgi:hypothetical protein
MGHVDAVILMTQVATDDPAAMNCPPIVERKRRRRRFGLKATRSEGNYNVLPLYVLVLRGVIGMIGILNVPGYEMMPGTSAACLRLNPTGLYPLGVASVRVAAPREDGIAPSSGKCLGAPRLLSRVALNDHVPLSLGIGVVAMRMRNGLWGRGVITLPSRALLIRTGIGVTAACAAATPPMCTRSPSPRPRLAAVVAARRTAKINFEATVATLTVMLAKIPAAMVCLRGQRSSAQSG